MAIGGGFGSIQHMITTLKNNRALLKRSTRFKRKKGIFEIEREDYFIGTKDKVEIKPISEEQKQQIRRKLGKEKKVNLRITLIVVLVFLFLTTIVTIRIVKKINISQIKHNQQQIEKQDKQRAEEYQYYIKDGDKWLNKHSYNNAKFQYNIALSKNFNNGEALKRLILAYTQECINEEKNCDLIIEDISKLIQVYPKFSPLYEILITCKERQGDTVGLYKYSNVLNDLKLTKK